jgi:hypothetical protein
MKTIQDMTIRQRSRMGCNIGAVVMLVIFLCGVIFQDWIFFFLGPEELHFCSSRTNATPGMSRRTRITEPHADSPTGA